MTKMSDVAQLRATRRYLTAFLLNIPIPAQEMTVGTLMTLLDDFCEHPTKYKEIINDRQNS
jgi:hypothetical protein